MTTKEKIAVMQAFVDGHFIECRKIHTADEWREAYPKWDWQAMEYRVQKKRITEGMTGLTVGGHKFHVWKKFDDRWRGVVSNDRHYVNVTWADDGQSKVYSPYSIPL